MSASDLSTATEEPGCEPPTREPAGESERNPPLPTPLHTGEPGEEAVDAPVVSPTDTRHHWMLLIVAAAIVLLAALLQVRDGEHVGLPGIRNPLPGVCTFRRVTGRPCPGCGLTRSFVSIAHGDLWGAWVFNPAGLLIFLVVAGQIPYRAWRLWRIRWGVDRPGGSVVAVYLVWAMVVVLMGQWLVRLLPLF